MKAQLFFFFITILCCQFIQPTASAQSSTIEKDEPNKVIKYIEEYIVDVLNDEKIFVASLDFDKNGLLTKQQTMDSDLGMMDIMETNYKYNVDGNLVQRITNVNGVETFKLERKYGKGNLVEEKSKYGTTKFSYDKQDNLILKEEHDTEGNFSKSNKYVMTYVQWTSDLESKVHFKKSGNEGFQRYSETFYTYQNGKLKKEINRANSYVYVNRYKYSLKGNLIEKVILNGDTEKTIIKFREDGNRIIESIFRSKDVDSPMEIKQENKWTYDEHGNEILFESFRDDKVVERTIREITYW